MANFYEKLMSEGFYKEASSGVETGMSKDTIKELLDSSFSSEQMESLAEELGLMFEKEAAEEAVNLDDSIAKESAEEVVEEEAKKEASFEEKDKETSGGEDSEEDKAEVAANKAETEKEDDGEDKMAAMVQEMREKIASITTELAKVSEFIESFEKEAAEDSKKEDGEEEEDDKEEEEDKEEEDKKAEEATEEEISKEAAEEAMMIKEAYDQAAQYLAENDYTLADFVYSKVGDEHLALQIAEAAEKLAYVQDSNPLMEADVLISKIAEILE